MENIPDVLDDKVVKQLNFVRLEQHVLSDIHATFLVYTDCLVIIMTR